MSKVEIGSVEEHNDACDRIAELKSIDPEGSPETIAEALALADGILDFWKNAQADSAAE